MDRSTMFKSRRRCIDFRETMKSQTANASPSLGLKWEIVNPCTPESVPDQEGPTGVIKISAVKGEPAKSGTLKPFVLGLGIERCGGDRPVLSICRCGSPVVLHAFQLQAP